MILVRLLALALLAGTLASSAPPSAAQTAPPTTPAPAAGDVVAQRGALRLTAAEVHDLVERADPAVRTQLGADPAALTAFVRERILQLALVAEAQAKGFDQRPEVIQRMNDARDAALAQAYLAAATQPDAAYPTDADIAAAYESNKARFAVPKQYHLAQIAILVPQGAPRDADDQARRKLQDLRTQALRPKADFADLARKNSQDRNGAEHGGDIGWVREDQLVAGVKEAVVNLADGAISDPLRGPSGWHLVKLLGTRPASVAPLADVREQIVQALRQARQQQLARAYIDDLQRREPIQLNEIDLARAVAPR
jgi:peptidylprolyl isomerase